MSTSGSNIFVTNRDELITGALQDSGAIDLGVIPPPNLLAIGMRELNMEIQKLQGEGINIWSRDWIEGITALSGEQKYTFTDTDLLNIDAINFIEGGAPNTISYPIDIVDRQYMFKEIGQLKTSGRPTHVSLEPGFSDGTWKYTLRFYPIPEKDYTFEVLAVRKLDDFTSGTDDPAFPPRWYDTLQYGLSLRLAPKTGAQNDRIAFLDTRYKEAKRLAKNTDYEGRKGFMRGLYNYRKRKNILRSNVP